jgi:hypothetical protein
MSKSLDDVSATFRITTHLDKESTDQRCEQVCRCPLCGYEFSWEEGEKICQACLIKKRCRLIMCPRCHHEFPKT